MSIPGLMVEVLGGWLVYSKELWGLQKRKTKRKKKKGVLTEGDIQNLSNQVLTLSTRLLLSLLVKY